MSQSVPDQPTSHFVHLVSPCLHLPCTQRQTTGAFWASASTFFRLSFTVLVSILWSFSYICSRTRSSLETYSLRCAFPSCFWNFSDNLKSSPESVFKSFLYERYTLNAFCLLICPSYELKVGSKVNKLWESAYYTAIGFHLKRSFISSPYKAKLNDSSNSTGLWLCLR
jgi:hypothetical protein